MMEDHRRAQAELERSFRLWSKELCSALATLDALAPIWSLVHLSELRLRGNLVPAAMYRRQGRSALPLLKTLDGSDVSGTAVTQPRAVQVQETHAGQSSQQQQQQEEETEEERRARLMLESVERWREVSEEIEASEVERAHKYLDATEHLHQWDSDSRDVTDVSECIKAAKNSLLNIDKTEFLLRNPTTLYTVYFIISF